MANGGKRWVGCPCKRGHSAARTALACAKGDADALRVQMFMGRFNGSTHWYDPVRPSGASADELRAARKDYDNTEVAR